MHNSINEITSSTDDISAKLLNIDSDITLVSEEERVMRFAMENQSASSKQIITSIKDLNTITEKVKSGSDEILKNSQQATSETATLNVLTSQVQSDMAHVTQDVNSISESIGHVHSLSKENTDSIKGLLIEVNKFIID